jgi:hypothetical protein
VVSFSPFVPSILVILSLAERDCSRQDGRSATPSLLDDGMGCIFCADGGKPLRHPKAKDKAYIACQINCGC